MNRSEFRFVPVTGTKRKGYGHHYVVDRETKERVGSLRPMYGGGYALYNLTGDYLDFSTLSREPSARILRRMVTEQVQR